MRRYENVESIPSVIGERKLVEYPKKLDIQLYTKEKGIPKEISDLVEKLRGVEPFVVLKTRGSLPEGFPLNGEKQVLRIQGMYCTDVKSAVEYALRVLSRGKNGSQEP